jgi:exodeoxyribonuclease VII large subunit
LSDYPDALANTFNNHSEVDSYSSISELINLLSNQLYSNQFKNIWLRGELINYTFSANQNHFFSLQDDNASIECVAFSNSFQKLDQKTQLGKEVLVHGSVDIYKKRGRLQFVADFIYFGNRGSKEAELMRLKQTLQDEGLFEESRKRILPQYPETIGIVTSAQGAVIKDLIQIINRRWPLVHVVLSPASVQGSGADQQIINALDLLSTFQPDITIIARGGGADEDFDIFNSEKVVRSIFKFKHPVITALGHQKNSTLSDLVSDVSVATPSEAAEIITPDTIMIKKYINDLQSNTYELLKNRLSILKNAHIKNLSFLTKNRFNILEIKNTANKNLNSISQTTSRTLFETKLKNQALKDRMDALSHKKVMERGYSIITNKKNEIINNKKVLIKEKHFMVNLIDGAIESSIRNKND